MEIVEGQYQRIANCLPSSEDNVTIPNLQVLNAILNAAEHGCK